MIREWLVEVMEWLVGEETMFETFLLSRNCSTCELPIYDIFRDHVKKWHGEDMASLEELGLEKIRGMRETHE